MRITKRVRSVVTALAVAAGTLAGSAGSGAAAPPPPGRLAAVEIVKASGTVADFENVSATCPGWKVAIGGGAEADFGENPGSGHTLELIQSRPVMDNGAATGWTASAHHLYTQFPLTVTAYAICAATPPGYEVLRSGPAELPEGGAVTLTCPTGKVALGGGGEIPPAYQTSLSKSYPASSSGSGAPDQWVVSGYDTDHSTTTTGYAICADPITDMTVHQYSAPSDDNPYGGLLKCPAGTSVVGGGASANGPWASLFASRPAKAAETGSRDGWWTEASDDAWSHSMDLFVMCAQPV
ncbi:hypothetical protein [Streptomyces cinereoruber]|uniref:hypothetical protein n=1 Tax=Streptomyces cinereoruber TaxID=67260 RepID=UPI0036423334